MSASRMEQERLCAVAFEETAEASPAPRRYECDACGREFEGAPGGSGLLVWTRGADVRYEEPPLCEECASEITIGALMKWDVDEEEG